MSPSAQASQKLYNVRGDLYLPLKYKDKHLFLYVYILMVYRNLLTRWQKENLRN